MSELKPRDIWEVANQLEGYVGPDTEECLAEFLIREGREAAKLAERIVELENELNTRAASDVPELETVGHLWECAEYYREERGWYGYIKLITEESPSHHVSPISKIRSHRELVTRDQAAEIIAVKDKEIERLRKKLRQEFQLGLTTLERAEAAEAKLAQYEMQDPVGWMYVNEDGECEQIEYGEPLNDPYITKLYTSPAPAADLKAENEKLREALRKAHANLEIDRTGSFEEFKNIINLALEGDPNA